MICSAVTHIPTGTPLPYSLGMLSHYHKADSSDWLTDTVPSLATLYTELHKEFPRSDMIKRIPLFFLSGMRVMSLSLCISIAHCWWTGEDFRRAVREYLKPKLRKGVPSLFVDIKRLYADTTKVLMINQSATNSAIVLTQLLSGADYRWGAEIVYQ